MPRARRRCPPGRSRNRRWSSNRSTAATGEDGWTVTWNGRGWWQTFEEYLELVRAACAIGLRHARCWSCPRSSITSPQPGETPGAPRNTTTRPAPSSTPTSAGSAPCRCRWKRTSPPPWPARTAPPQRLNILEWLRRVPGLIRAAAPGRRSSVGLKLFNSLDDDAFQLADARRSRPHPAPPDFLVYANRLFDPDRVFEGQRGVAYGGPDLSDRNLRMLSALQARPGHAVPSPGCRSSSRATGDISSGRIAVEYALRGCTSFQIHTLFQLPASEYAMRRGHEGRASTAPALFRPSRRLHRLGVHAAKRLGLAHGDCPVRFLDLAHEGAARAVERQDLDPQPA